MKVINVATYTFVHFEHEEATALARLQSIHFDLFSVVQLCEYFDAQCKQSLNYFAGSEVTDAFSTAILVRYSRAFSSGVRKGLGDEALATLSSEQRQNHERLRAFRDKHIAHSVNAFEDTKVQARYCAERVEQEGITSVSAAHYRVVGLSSKDIGDTIDLCKALLRHVEDEIAKEERRLLLFIRSLPQAEVLSRPSSSVLGPDLVTITARRQRP